MRGRDLASRPKGVISRALMERQEGTPETPHDATHQIDLLAKRTGSLGSSGSARARASLLNRAAVSRSSEASVPILQMQRHHGNRHVQRVIAIARQNAGDGKPSGEVEQAIQRARGGGHSLSRAARARMEPAFGVDFSNVRVHTGNQADALSQSLGARAFTTGRDIFFRQGEYSPVSSKGRELLAHELTHVMQQSGGGIQSKLTVSQPGDAYEQQADRVAKEVLHREQITRQPFEEEEEMMQMQRLPGVDANVFR
jgi:hypothetical protein